MQPLPVYGFHLMSPRRFTMHELVKESDLKYTVFCLKAFIVADIADAVIISCIDAEAGMEQIAQTKGPGKVNGGNIIFPVHFHITCLRFC